MKFKLYDPIIEAYVRFDVSKYYLKFSIENRTYYFDRDTFEFDGVSIALE